MNVPLRALSWAMRFFWIITLAFAITCAYSATLTRIDFGQPFIVSEEDLEIVLPLAFENNGYYTMDNLNITTVIVGYNDTLISKGTSHVLKIPSLTHSTILHNVSLNINEVVAQDYYLFNDSDLTLLSSIGLNYAHLIPSRLEGNCSVPWGAPLFNFTIGTTEYAEYNATHLRASVPIAFQNHSPYFSLVGSIRIQILNDRDQLSGAGTIRVDAPAGSSYTAQIEALMRIETASHSGEIHVYFETTKVNYGPVVANYG